MSKPIISVESLSKKYIISHSGSAGDGLRHQLNHFLTMPARAARMLAGNGQKEKNKEREEFWALKDISFEVEQGTVLGVIGRNGAGKSTLLKLLSRITEPTKGRVVLRGRVASLLEVGTGFHPELSGRENIFLNGAILGMTRVEIKRKFDEIVAFAEVDRFIDTPVKRYSSGMYVRLAFAVAAHLEPEILLVDEVLAVGDMTFQKKCLGKMDEVARGGRTVLFVSHNMATVQNLCTKSIMLQSGQMEFEGTAQEGVSHYLLGQAPVTGLLKDRKNRRGSGEIRLTDIRYKDGDGYEVDHVCSGQDIEIWLAFEAQAGFSGKDILVSIQFINPMGTPVFNTHNRSTGDMFGKFSDAGHFTCRIPKLPLPPGIYRLNCTVMQSLDYLDLVEDAAELQVVSGNFFESGDLPPASQGAALLSASWRIES